MIKLNLLIGLKPILNIYIFTFMVQYPTFFGVTMNEMLAPLFAGTIRRFLRYNSISIIIYKYAILQLFN